MTDRDRERGIQTGTKKGRYKLRKEPTGQRNRDREVLFLFGIMCVCDRHIRKMDTSIRRRVRSYGNYHSAMVKNETD